MMRTHDAPDLALRHRMRRLREAYFEGLLLTPLFAIPRRPLTVDARRRRLKPDAERGRAHFYFRRSSLRRRRALSAVERIREPPMPPTSQTLNNVGSSYGNDDKHI